MDKEHVATLIAVGGSPAGLAAAQKVAAKNWEEFPHNGCAYNLSALLIASGISVPMTGGAGALAKRLAERGWNMVVVGKQKAGDVGVTFDKIKPPGADHIYLVVDAVDGDKMLIADNQDTSTHTRYASGKGKTRTEYFLRAS